MDSFGETGAWAEWWHAVDWSATPLGPADSWPPRLQLTVGMMLRSQAPMILWWGERWLVVYNDAYRKLAKDAAPSTVGQPAARGSARLWAALGPVATGVVAGGGAVCLDDFALLSAAEAGTAEEPFISLACVPVHDERGDAVGVLILLQDSTVRVRRERRLRQQLDLKTEELTGFSYSVSHDLRAPLRAIDGFSEVILADHAATLPADALHLLERIRAATARMGRQMDGLLALSRADRLEITHRRVDLSALAAEMASELRKQDPSRDVEFSIEPGVAAHGDSALLRVALGHLLSNAWKFTGRNTSARIRFGRRKEGDEEVFFVADNGVGFDPAYAHRLFNAFQRLHSESRFPGVGIGLALVARIVRRHGGRVWAEGALGEGATFRWTLPEGS